MKIRLIIQFILLFIWNPALAQELITNSITPVSYYVDHINELGIIKTNLDKYHQTSLVGISGIGKTQLARLFVYENKKKYDLIWFFDCNLNIDDEFLRLGIKINSITNSKIIKEDSKSAKNDVMHYLSSKERWLLIFDNLKIGENTKILDFVNWEHNGNIIFCSQDSEKLPHTITLNALATSDSQLLVSNIIENRDKSAIEFLTTEFKGYPMLTVQGTQLLNTIKGLSTDEYKKKLDNSTDKIELNIKLAISHLSNSAKHLLYKIALINNQRFSKEVIALLVDNKENLEGDLYQLSKFVLISCVDANPTNPIFEMHDVIAGSTRKINGEKNNKNCLEDIISKLVHSIPRGVFKAHIFRNAVTMHENLEVMLKNEQIYNSNIYKTMELNLHLLGNYSNASDFANAEKLVEWFKKKDQAGQFRLSFMNNHEKGIYSGYVGTIGTYYRKRLADHKSALNFYNRAIKVMEEVSGFDDWKFNLAYLSALSNISLGQIMEAEKNISKMGDIAVKGSIDNADLGMIQRIKAKLNYYQGNYKDALTNVNSGISESTKNGVNPQDPVMTTPYVLKASILNALGLYQEASIQIELLRNIHTVTKKEDHLVFGRIFTQKARSELGLGNMKEASETINKAINILLADESRNSKSANFLDDEDLGESYIVKGDILYEQGKLSEAIESYRKAQKIYFYLYKNNINNIAHVSYLYLQGARASCQAKDLYNYKCFGNPQVKEFGREHPNTILMLEYCQNYNLDLWSEEN